MKEPAEWQRDKKPETYKGFKVWKDRWAPVTGRFAASRHGVGMCHGNWAGLERMIDTKVYEESEETRFRRDGKYGGPYKN